MLHTQVMREDFQFEDEEAGSLLPHFPKAFKKIRQGLEDGGVLVYCETGQASVALVAAFLMAEQVGTLRVTIRRRWTLASAVSSIFQGAMRASPALPGVTL